MMNKTITIEVNGLIEQVEQGLTVSELIDHFKEGDFDLIVEINGRYIYPKAYRDTWIIDGDSIEFINPNLGG